MNELPHRVLVVDDNVAIHGDFRKILAPPEPRPHLVAAEATLFGATATTGSHPPRSFALTFAAQGEEAVACVQSALAAGERIALAFVDVRMPPGIDGIETVQRLWAIDPEVQIVICSAYSDLSWAEMTDRLRVADGWVILKKPFDNVEVLQLAHALTEKWALRQQTQAHLANLEQTVSARTADLGAALSQLQREIADRERAEGERRAIERKMEETQRLESLGVLAGGIAHDFNNILTGIQVSASLARMDVPDDSELQGFLRQIEENSHRAAGLCEQMLTYAGKTRVNSRPLDLNGLLRSTLDLVRISVPKDARLAVELGDALPAILGDPTPLRQVFMNLVINAAEALDAPPREIRMTSGSTRLTQDALQAMSHPGDAAPGEFAFLEVSDTGAGIPPDVLRRIFEPFYTTKFAGRGLGLSAVLGVMRAHRGALDVHSTPGRGTVFRVYFPAVSGIGESDETPGQAPVGRLSGTVLVADDDPAVRQAASGVLHRLGMQVLLANDGLEALELAESHAPMLRGVLLDLTMPRLDGAAALARLRRAHPGLPVALMSGFHRGDVARRFPELGELVFIQKPFSVDELGRVAAETFGAGASEAAR